MRRVLRAITVGDTVCVHSYKGEKRRATYRIGWRGYVHAIEGGKYHVSQRDPSCWASCFWMAHEEVHPCIQTFEGLLCLRCRK